jgi:hypothetical protein
MLYARRHEPTRACTAPDLFALLLSVTWHAILLGEKLPGMTAN